ncbi:MAG: FAD-dependent oxidoreductase [Verrucomicrobia bacterium]|nr:FAD-dependent oxidoreductase [Verrucomicrobiota bacterium]
MNESNSDQGRPRPAALRYFDPQWISPSSETVTCDVCVYGGTAAGVVAAVTALQRGHSVTLLHPGQFLGGMTTGGLGWTDFGHKEAIGGLSRRFYADLGAHYGKEEEWQFEPHVAQAVTDAWLQAHDVRVLRGQYLEGVELDASVRKIRRIGLFGGLKVEAKQFVDATYEGDLMAAAGVSFTVGRESNATYGETVNGIQVRSLHQFNPPVDPYVIPGVANSGLLPQVENVDQRAHAGKGDKRIQAYCFRMCMTDDPALKIDWEKPGGYDPLEYELARRWFNSDKDEYNDQMAGQRLVPAKFDIFPNRTPGAYRKTDTNNHGPVSSDYIGMNWRWPEADYETREQIFQQHVTYQKGFYWCMANDPAIPRRYRDAYAAWGLPCDEYIETGHWPHQLYVREARRMVSDHVITEQVCVGERSVEDPVGLGSYAMDSHNCTRFVMDGGVMNDGDVQTPLPAPYPVSYRSIVPKRGECENLWVPVCLSASHIAYGSVRMEPVFMALAESAVVAATMAIENGCSAQDLPYEELRGELESRGQAI